MTELTSGMLTFEQLDAEVIAIMDDFNALGVDTLYITFGFGCDPDLLMHSDELPIATGDLAGFLEEREAAGSFDLGESNIHIKGGGLEFLLCHERDVHCSGDESTALRAIRKRWARWYEHGYERRNGGRWRRLSGRAKDSRET